MQDNNQQQVTPSEFSKKIKEKYPQYKDIDDVTLAKKMIEKYPEYSGRVNFNIEKKNSVSTGTAPQKDSQSKATPKPSTSDGGKQPQVKPSGSSFGEGNKMFGGLNVLPPAPQPSSKRPEKAIPNIGEGIQLTPKKQGVKTDASGNVIFQENKPFQSTIQEVKKQELDKKEVINKANTPEVLEKQAQGILPPNSFLINSGEMKLDVYSGGFVEDLLKPKSFTLTIKEQAKPFAVKVKESYKPVKINYDNLIKANDFDLPYPYLYFSKSKEGDNQVNEFYTNNISDLQINKDDFDGFLRKKGYLNDINKDIESGLYKKDRGVFSENYNEELIKEKRLVDYLSLYIEDKNQRNYDLRVIQYKKANPNATEKDIENNVTKYTFLNNEDLEKYIEKTFPVYSKSLKERKNKEKEEWEETKKNKGDFFSWQTVKKIGSGLSETLGNRISDISSTVYDLIGLDKTASQIRFSAEEDAFNRPENRDISYVSGKRVNYKGNEYLVDSEGQIYDYELKKRITDLFDNNEYKAITNSSKRGTEDSMFSWTGATIQTTNVLADLAVQIALTRGVSGATGLAVRGLSKEGLSLLSKMPVSNAMASSATSQTLLGYSEGLESTLLAAKNAGINDTEAKAIANDAAMKTAALYLFTYGISPQTKAAFNKQKNELVKEAIDVYAKKGKSAYVKFLNNGINDLGTFLKEGTKETGQEVIQDIGTVYGINPSINEAAGKDIVQTEMTADQVISMLPSTFVAGGIPIMARNIGGIFSRKDYLSNLDVASNNVDLSNKRLDELLANNAINKEEHTNAKEDLRVYSQNKNKIPKDTSVDIVLDVAKKLDEISKLEASKNNLDKAFHEKIDQEINNKRTEIKELYEKQSKETTAEKPTEEGPTGQENVQDATATQGQPNQVVQEEVEPRIKDSQIPLKRETFESETDNGTPFTIEVTTNKDGSRKIVTKVDGAVSGGEIVGKDNTLSTEEYLTKAYGDIIGEPIVEQGNDIMAPAMKKKLTPKQKAELGIKDDAEVKTTKEAKEEVNKLRTEEVNELTENVENPQDFITDGKVDATKIAESDNAKAKEIYAKYDKQIKPLLTNIKTQEDAIQKQSTDEGVLRPEQSEMGLQEVVKGDQELEVVTEEVKSEEEITKIKADLDASKERLKNAFDKYKNVNIAFDPKNQLAKDKELVKALLDYAYNNIKLGKYNAVKLIEDLAKDGIEITRDGARYIFDRASKRVQREVNKTAGIKQKPTEQKRINKAYSIGVADQKVETQKQKEKTKEVRAELKSKLKEVVSQIKKEKDVAKKEALQKQADRLNKKIADLREKSKAEVSELKDQIRDIFSSAKEVIRIDKKLTKENRIKLAKDINSIVESKKISKRRFKSLINMINKVDINNPAKFDEVVSYAEKLMKDEMYAEKVSEAKLLISSIKKMSKNKLKDIDLVNIARDFSLIKPIKVADIDSLIEIGVNIKQALKSTSITANKIDISKPLDINSVKPAVDAILLEQNKNEESDRIKEMEYYLGVNEGDLSLDELEAAIEDTSKKSKMNSEEVRAKIIDIYDTTSAIVSETIRKGEDLFTGDKIDFNKKDLSIVDDILKLDIRDISVNKKIIQLIDVLNNFLVNGESNGLELAYRDALGEVNSKKATRRGIISKGLKFLYGSGMASRIYMQEVISIDKINDIYFKGFETGSYIDKASGLSDIMFNVSKTKKEIYNKLDSYKKKFQKTKPNDKGFFSSYNIVERGMYAFVTRTIDGSQKDVESEFKRRKGIIEDSIDSMMNSNDNSLIEKAIVYQEVFNKIIGSSNRVEDITIDKINKDAVDLMKSYWEGYYEDASDLSLRMYNTVLGKDVNYTHDSYSQINKKEKDVTDEINENFSFIVNQHITKKKSSTLLEVTRANLQDNLYVDLSFEESNFKAMKDTAIDISTTKYNRQMASFLNSPSFSKLIPVKEDRELYRRRIVSYINRVKGRDFVPKDELKGIDDTLNALNSFGTALLLGGVTQPLKQTIPVAVNTLFNARDLSLSIVFNKDVVNFMRNNGYAVSYRGIESLSNIEESRSNFESINKSNSKAISEWIQDKSKTYLKLFLGNADAFIAMASWMTYYKQRIIQTKGKEYFDSIDWKTHKVDRDAGDYAQKQLDRQQAPSDVELKGELFSGKETHKKIASKLLFPLSSFSLNQKSRMYNDISVLFSKESFSDNDKKIAAWSLAGLAAEQVIFRSIQAGIGYLLLEASASISGLGDDDEELKEEKEKLKKNIIKGASTSFASDILSPIPSTDEYTSGLINDALDIMYSASDVKEEDKFFLYDSNSKRKESAIDIVGIGGATIDKALSIRESSIMATKGEFTSNFNGKKSEKIISNKSKDMMISAATIEILSFMTILPSEGFNISNSIKKFAKKNSVSIKERGKFISEYKDYGYTEKEAEKIYDEYIEYMKEELNYED